MNHITSSELFEWRKENGISYEGLAVASGIPSFQLSSFERGQWSLEPRQHQSLINALGNMLNDETDQLNLQSTHNGTQHRRFCWPERQCYRLLECKYCWRRQSKHIRDQLQFFAQHRGWTHFATLSLLGSDLDARGSLRAIGNFRRLLHRRLFKSQSYFSLIAVGPTETGWVPHFHIVSTDFLTHAAFKEAMSRIPKCEWQGMRPNLCIKAVTDAKGLGSYLMEQNLRPTLRLRPRRLRLITASRGFLAGRPRSLKHLLALEAK